MMTTFKATNGDDNFQGSGTDSITYASVLRPVTIDLSYSYPQYTGGSGTDTLTGIRNATGSDFNDSIGGTDDKNSLSGGGGNDTLYGAAGDDMLKGGDGDDVLDGGAGNDTVQGGAGDDYIYIYDGNDKIDGGDGYDSIDIDYRYHMENIVADLTALWTGGVGRINGTTIKNVEAIARFHTGDGDDVVRTGDMATGLALWGGNDIAYGGNGNDYFSGIGGNDTLHGGGGTDVLDGGDGDDKLYGDAGDDTLYGGYGDGDIAYYAGPRARYIVVDQGGGYYQVVDSVSGATGEGTDTLVNVEKIAFSDGTFAIESIAGPLGLFIHSASDLEYFPSPMYTESLAATPGNDTLTGSAGNDLIFANSGADTINGGAGDDYIEAQGAEIRDTDGNAGDGYEVIGSDTIQGGAGDDYIAAGYGTTIDGGTGIDTVKLSLTNDYLHGAAHSILYWFNDMALNVDLGQAQNGTVTLQIGGLGPLPITLTHVEAFDITLGYGDDRVTGGAYDDVLDGGGGADILHGGAGNDRLSGGGNDYGGTNSLYGDDGDDQLYATSPGSNIYYDNVGEEYLYGGNGDDFLAGSQGDLLDGGAGTGDSVLLDLGASDHDFRLDLDALQSGAAYNLGDADLQVDYLHHGTRVAGIEHLAFLRLGSGNDIVTASAAKLRDYAGNGHLPIGSGILLGDGDDQMTINGTIDARDHLPLSGGDGTDTLILNGDYADGFFLGYGVATEFETLRLQAGHTYSLTAGFLSGFTTFDASALGARDALTLDLLEPAPGATVIGGAGADRVILHNIDTAPVSIDLGGGTKDVLVLDGDFSDGLDLTVHQILNVETFLIGNYYGPQPIDLILSDTTVASGKKLTIGDASQGYDSQLTVDGRAETNGALTLFGGTANDVLAGGAKNDELRGGAGNDTLIGGGGKDMLWGGTGADTFRFEALTDLAKSAATDLIGDFSSAEHDRIDLSPLDANSLSAGNQAFAFIGTAAFGHVAGQLRYAVAGNQTTVSGDVNGDGTADFLINLAGTHALTAGDFIL